MMKTKNEYFHNIKELPKGEQLTPGSPLCAGCGGLSALRLMLNVLGPNTVVVNAAGCMTLMAVYPFTPLKACWLYTSMGSAPAGAQGIRDALDVLISKNRLSPEEDLQVVVVAGDGATFDIGLSSLSGAIHRGLNFYYLCYDNEAFGNTGFQMSSSTPFGSETATSRAAASRCEGTVQRKKDIFSLWKAQCPPYIATVSTADPIDLADKVRRASCRTGPKLFTALAACPTGWGYDPSQSHHVAKLALETGIWPLKEAIDGEERHTVIPQKRRPAKEYLKTQRRYRHLFSPKRQEAVIAQIQQDVDHYWYNI